MNPGVLFLPVYRASTTAFLLGLLVLAVIDFARISSGVPFLSGWLGLLAMAFFVYSLHANRLRYADRGTGLAALPLGIAIVIKGIGAVVGILPGAIQSMTDFAASRGVNTEDQQALAEAMQDPAFAESWMTALETDEALQASLQAASGTSSFIGFWLVIALFAIWFAQMKRLGGSLESVRDTTPSMMNPEPLAPSEPAAAPAEVAEETAPESAEAAPAEEAPVEVAPVENEPVEEAPTENAQAEGAPAEDEAPEDTASDDKSKD